MNGHLMNVLIADIPHFVMVQASFQCVKHPAIDVKTSQDEIRDVRLPFIQILERVILV